jgi:secreted trypsin-like serine protease
VISADAVLTAGHCMVDEFGDPSNPNSFRVVTGRPDLTDDGAGQELGADDVFVHRRFLRRGHRDVAVIRLDDPTTATPAVLPTPMEARQATQPGDELRVAGWGSTKRAGGAASDVLRDVATFAVKDRKCEKWPFLRFKSDEDICTQGERMGDHRASSCYGDSGGPLVADTAGGARLVGAVSRGGLRCGVEQPTIYASVGDNLDFITTKAGLP